MRAEIEAVLRGDSKWCVMQGDCLELLASMPADSASLAFGSPPYTQARLYLENGENLGIAREAEEWSTWMLQVFRACLRVATGLTGMVVEGQTMNFRYDAAPYLLAADLCRAGICLRKPPIYRRIGIPGGGGREKQHAANGGSADWLKNCYEPIIVATRGGKLPWADTLAMGHAPKYAPGGACTHRQKDGVRRDKGGISCTATIRGRDGKLKPATSAKKNVANGYTKEGDVSQTGVYEPPARANPGNVIDCPEELIDCAVGGGRMGNNLACKNEAPFPEKLAEFFVRSFCPPGGVVIDPFAGSGTTLAVAVMHGRRAIGFDLRGSQIELTKRRMAGVTPVMFSGR